MIFHYIDVLTRTNCHTMNMPWRRATPTMLGARQNTRRELFNGFGYPRIDPDTGDEIPPDDDNDDSTDEDMDSENSSDIIDSSSSSSSLSSSSLSGLNEDLPPYGHVPREPGGPRGGEGPPITI